MGAAIFKTRPSVQRMMVTAKTPMIPQFEKGVVVIWTAPLGKGAVPHVSLDHCEYFARWLYDHPDKSNGMDLKIAIDPIYYEDVAATFEKALGELARYIDIPIYIYLKHLPVPHDELAGYNADRNDPATRR